MSFTEEANSSLQDLGLSDISIFYKTDDSFTYSTFTDDTRTEADSIFVGNVGKDPFKSETNDFPFRLKYSIGHQCRVPILNLSTVERKRLFIVSGHIGIILEWEKNIQLLLEGHRNDITCSAVSDDKKWIATSDQGPDNAFILWDANEGLSVKAITNYYPLVGVSFLEFSPDGMTLLTIGSSYSPQNLRLQELCLWDWNTKCVTPFLSYEFNEELGDQHFCVVHRKDSNHFVTCSTKSVTFFQIVGENLHANAPPILQEDFKKTIGDFTQTAFVLANDIALTATALGSYMVWGNEKSAASYKKDTLFAHPNDRFLVRLLQPQAGRSPIRVLTVTENYTISCNDRGVVNFYDEDLRVIKTIRNINKGAINGISFTYDPLFYVKKIFGKQSMSDSACSLDNFKCSDFVVSTVSGFGVYVTTEMDRTLPIYNGTKYRLRAIASFPNGSYICFGDYNGLLRMWNYRTRETLAMHQLTDDSKEIECLNFDSTGTYLACGLTDGTLLMFDVPTLTRTPDFKFNTSKYAILFCKFSPDSQFIATADRSHAVSLYRVFCIKPAKFDYREKHPDKIRWKLIGRQRQHYQQIVDIMFNYPIKRDHLFLFSLGKDRLMVIYDITTCPKDELIVTDIMVVDQTALPLCMMWYTFYEKSTLIAIANDEYKLKIHDIKTKQCIKTIAQPVFDSPIIRMFIVTSSDEFKDVDELDKYLVFATSHNIGLCILPADGNPFKSAAVLAHAKGVHDIVASSNGEALFSTGNEDTWIHMWKIQPGAVHLRSKSGGEGMTPFFNIIPGGKDGPVLSKLSDFFLYVQIKRLGEDYMAPIEISNEIHVEDIPYIMAALGYYPSIYETSLLLNDAKFSISIANGTEGDMINMLDIITLYINHRPVFPLDSQKLLEAFGKISGDPGESSVIPRHHFLKTLDELGEPMRDGELLSLLKCLGSRSRQSVTEAGYKATIQRILPHRISQETLMIDILGFEGVRTEDNKNAHRWN